MRIEIQQAKTQVEHSIDLLKRFLDFDSAKKSLEDLNVKAESPELWNDQKAAQALLKERTYLAGAITSIEKLTTDLTGFVELLFMGESEGDEIVVSEAENEILQLAKEAKLKEVECLFSGEVDCNSCFLEVHAGAGGTESHDWAEMLFRMYCRWAEEHKFKCELIDKFVGEEAGIKSATIKILGHNAYGWLKNESGVHRLVRISPFNAAGKRHTSFASAWVYPVIDDTISIEIKESDLRIDTYRSSGAGGQHVNTTDSAVRITHLPSGIVVQSQSNRSQHKNKDECYSMLRSRLYEAEMQKRLQETQKQNASKTEIGWGNQIRSYVLHPYQMVKDARTAHEDTDTKAILDGHIDEFMIKNLELTTSGKGLKK
ncbi:MAG: peptide chain release factor 2 [Rickettsiales bacterium]